MLFFDIGANRGDATVAGLQKGYKIIAMEPAPRIFNELVKNFLYNKNVVPLKVAVSDKDNQRIEFYEADEDGLSTLNKEWLTSETLPYNGKPFRTISVNTITLDTLVSIYGEPDLIKVDVEGAEWNVFNGMSKAYGKLAFEWTQETVKEHEDQLKYLKKLGYKEVAPQFIVNHLDEPEEWFKLDKNFSLYNWIQEHKDNWINGEWKKANLRPTADVGMVWIR